MSEEKFSLSNLKTRAHIVYICYLIGLIFWIPLLVGIILAYLSRDKAREIGDPLLEDNFTWQINSFWGYLAFIGLPLLIGLMGLLSFDFAFLAFFAFLGVIIGLIGLIWFIYRTIKGWLALSEGKALYIQDQTV